MLKNEKYKNESMRLEPRKKLVFFVKQGLDNFLTDIIRNLSLKYDTKKIIVRNYKEIDEGMRWADICWFEWCDDLIVYGSKQKLAKEKIILCRLHRYECFTKYPREVFWDNVDKLILVTDHLKKLLSLQIYDIEKKVNIITIKNGVDMDKYKLLERKTGFNVAYVGYINDRKNPILLLQIIKKLVEKDQRFKLYVAGSFQSLLIKIYWNYEIKKMNLENNVVFEGWQKDISNWLEDKNYILSSSIHESFGYGIAEAMARGIKPVIHDFIYSNEIWDDKYLFNTVDEAVSKISEEEYNSKEYRKFIEDNYSVNLQMDSIERLLEGINKKQEKNKNINRIASESNEKDFYNCIKKMNDFIPYFCKDYDNYNFQSAKIIFGKREVIYSGMELIEYALKNDENKQIIINNIWYHKEIKSFVLPDVIDKSKNKSFIIGFAKELLETKTEFKNGIAGYVFEKKLQEDINKNFLAYNWQRAIPASKFMPLRGNLLIYERYCFASKFINENSKVLEAPCGFGYGAAYIAKFSNNVEASDIVGDNINFAKSVYPISNINWCTNDVTKLNYSENEFDIYISFEVFEHLSLDSIDNYLKEAVRVIKKGGKFIISTPNKSMRVNVNNPFHIKEYTFIEFKNILEKYFKDIEYYSILNSMVISGVNPSSYSLIAVCTK
ncbi:methyltransferase domain-containing protein [Haloimpatiens sp. FM7315]|uniref:methyltransferase domain-containing protein n=1 Tax=Haloimpatiens sp. FM7315 TaxID=3298609 RepID=UPI00370A2538